MNDKEKYLQDVNNRFNGEVKKILESQIELFYDNSKVILKNKYKLGEDVKLAKGTFLHGIPGLLDNFDWIVENGFIANEFTKGESYKKIKNSIGMWNIKNDCLLRDYIIDYSGFTITYTLGRSPDSEKVSRLIPYHKFDEETEKINNDENIWMYYGDQTKEVRFLPSLVSDRRQIAFILNMDSEYAKKMAFADIWNLDISDNLLSPFLDYRYNDKFLDERKNKNASTTDRESSIMFGLPASLIEGVLVGRKIEHEKESLDYIKKRLPECYICNLDGKVIVDNI